MRRRRNKMSLMTNPRLLLLAGLIIIAVLAINFEQLGPLDSGVKYGLEFTGGTYYQIQLEEQVSREQMDFITSIMSQRVDAFGLKDTKVNALGPDLIGI